LTIKWEAIKQALWQWQWEGFWQPFVLKRFGSRSCLYALPEAILTSYASYGRISIRKFKTLAAHCSRFSIIFKSTCNDIETARPASKSRRATKSVGSSSGELQDALAPVEKQLTRREMKR
jgi:hypothetical protein